MCLILPAVRKGELQCGRQYLLSALSVTSREGKTAPVFHPEFGRFMLEATPGAPWGIDLKDLLDVERDMKWRSVCFFPHTQC